MKIFTTTILRWWLAIGLAYFGARAFAADQTSQADNDYRLQVESKFEIHVATGRVDALRDGYNQVCVDPPACGKLHEVYKSAILDTLRNTKPHAAVELLKLGFKITEKDFLNKTPLDHAAEDCRPDMALELRALGADAIYGDQKMQVAHNMTLERQNEIKRLMPLPVWDYKNGKLKPGHEQELVDGKAMRAQEIADCKVTQWIFTPADQGGVDFEKVKQLVHSNDLKSLHQYLKENKFPDEKVLDMVFDPEDKSKTSPLHHAIQYLEVLDTEKAGVFSAQGGARNGASGAASGGSR